MAGADRRLARAVRSFPLCLSVVPCMCLKSGKSPHPPTHPPTRHQLHNPNWLRAHTYRPAPPLLDSFYRVRPVVETGWEVMLINRALQEGRYDASTILRDYTVCACVGWEAVSVDRPHAF